MKYINLMVKEIKSRPLLCIEMYKMKAAVPKTNDGHH